MEDQKARNRNTEIKNMTIWLMAATRLKIRETIFWEYRVVGLGQKRDVVYCGSDQWRTYVYDQREARWPVLNNVLPNL